MSAHVLYYADIEGAYDEPTTLAKLAGRIESLRTTDTVVGGAGDNTGPGVLPLLEEGRQSLEFFGRVDPDVDVFGNHDFDYGRDVIREVVRDAPQTWLATNVYDGDGNVFAGEEGAVPYAVLERGGTRIGAFGVSHPDTLEMAPNASALTFTDPCEAASRAVEALRERGVDHVVGFSHLGVDDALAETVPADVILGGHRNERRNEVIDGTRVVRTRGGRVELVEVELGDEVSATFHDIEDATPDEAVESRFRSLKDEHGLSEVVGRAPRPLGRRPLAGECELGNLIADALRWKADADAALVNSGSIRSGPPHRGPITTEDILGWIPFTQPVVVVELTGAELREVVREGAGKHLQHPDGERWHLQVSGVEVVWEMESARIESLRVDGDPVRDDETYRIATLLYVLVSDSEFRSITDDRRTVEIETHYEVIEEYIREHGAECEVEGRIVRRGAPETSATDGADEES